MEPFCHDQLQSNAGAHVVSDDPPSPVSRFEAKVIGGFGKKGLEPPCFGCYKDGTHANPESPFCQEQGMGRANSAAGPGLLSKSFPATIPELPVDRMFR